MSLEADPLVRVSREQLCHIWDILRLVPSGAKDDDMYQVSAVQIRAVRTLFQDTVFLLTLIRK